MLLHVYRLREQGSPPDIQLRRKVYEDLAKQHTQPSQLQLPSKKGHPRLVSVRDFIRRTPKAKPDSLIQKLLDRFDPSPKF